jgi:hypothetical protein
MLVNKSLIILSAEYTCYVYYIYFHKPAETSDATI